MSFYDVFKTYKDFDFEQFINNIKDEDVLRVIKKERKSEFDFLTLLSPKSAKYLEQMAHEAKRRSLQHFGKAILLYTPMYLANYCVNK